MATIKIEIYYSPPYLFMTIKHSFYTYNLVSHEFESFGRELTNQSISFFFRKKKPRWNKLWNFTTYLKDLELKSSNPRDLGPIIIYS